MEMFSSKKEIGSQLISLKLLLPLIFYSMVTTPLWSQQNVINWENQLHEATIIEGRCLGYSCHQSQIFAAFDSLTKYYDAQSFQELLADTNYVVKYYAYYGVVLQNDSLALELLKRYISDSSKVVYFANCVSETIYFNEEIASLYATIITMKYFYGGNGAREGFNLSFPEPQPALYRKKRIALNNLLKENNLAPIKFPKNRKTYTPTSKSSSVRTKKW